MGIIKGPITCQRMNTLAGQLKGHIDFYYWKGIPCFRRWPHGAETVLSLPRQMSADAFAEVARRKGRMPQLLREQFRRLAAGTTETWGDVFTRWNMHYYRLEGSLPPEITEFTIYYGSGIKEILITLAPLAGPIGSFFAGAFRWKNNPYGHKTYRGALTKCTPRGVSSRGPRWPLSVRGSGEQGYQFVTGRGWSKYVSFEGDWKPSWYYQNKCLALWPTTPEYYSGTAWSYAGGRICTYPGHGDEIYCAMIQGYRTQLWFTPVLPSGWTLDQVNGMRFYHDTCFTPWNQERGLRFEFPLGSNTYKIFPGRGSYFTVPYQPEDLSPVIVWGIPTDYALPVIWDLAENDLERIYDWPYTHIGTCKLTKGKRNQLSIRWSTPVVGNLALTYVPLSGIEHFHTPIVEIQDTPKALEVYNDDTYEPPPPYEWDEKEERRKLLEYDAWVGRPVWED